MSELQSRAGATHLGPRIGDAERNACVDRLTQEMVAGRLGEDEFDLRVERALRAQTQPDLAELTADLVGLPSPAPGPPRSATLVVSLSVRDVAVAGLFTGLVGVFTFWVATNFSGGSDEVAKWLLMWLFGEVCGLAGALLARGGRDH